MQMCGIVGMVNRNKVKIDEDMLIKMRDTVTHRGPNGEGIYVKRNIGLAHRRLSIVDSKKGHQPLFNEDNSVVIISNSEIYNYHELRENLIKQGHVFKTESDTEVIVHAYEQYGENCIRYLDGMFAFSIWDDKKQRLLIARDRFGIKPLYYYLDRRKLIFASEIKSILCEPSVERKLNKDALNNYLFFGFSPVQFTLFKNINKLLPGNILIFDIKSMKIKEYWDVNFNEGEKRTRSNEHYIQMINQKLEKAVRCRIPEKLPFGIFLSGGVDSSTITMFASFNTNNPVNTFTANFNCSEIEDETYFSDLISKYFNTNHYEVDISPSSFIKKLPQIIRHLDEPLYDPACVPIDHISSFAAKKGVKVMLSGEGSDELFLGYKTYLNYNVYYNHMYNLLPQTTKKGFVKLLNKFDNVNLRRIYNKLNYPFKSKYLGNSFIFDKFDKKNLYSDTFMNNISDMDSKTIPLKYHNKEKEGKDFLHEMSYLDIKTYLPDNLLLRSDKLSMAHSVETRTPYLDHSLASFVFNIPSNLKIRGLSTKYILKKALKNKLPRKVIYRKKKGFPTPLKYLISKSFMPYIKETLLDSKTLNRGLFKKEYIERLLNSNFPYNNKCMKIWTLLNLELWFRIFMDTDQLGYSKKI